jgi:RNA polymerase sigma-70 factor (ECF subfamily)
LGCGDHVRVSLGEGRRSAPSRNASTRKPRTTQKACDDLAFARLIGPCQGRIYRVALRITRNTEDAKDVQQETLLKVHRKLAQFKGRSQFTTWVHRIAVNEALMCLRKQRGASQIPLKETLPLSEDVVAKEDFQSPIEGPEAAYSREELRNMLTRAIQNLRPMYRIVFLMRVVKQFSTNETADVLELSSSVVKTRMNRARRELRNYLKQARSNHSHAIPNGKLGGSDLNGVSLQEGWLIQ